MSQHIDPDVMYRIRSRGVERPAMEGHRLAQLVRDFVLARHDELSDDGEHWFLAGDVESLFPSSANERLIRDRLVSEKFRGEPTQQAEQSQPSMDDERKFPREPWYVARASNVAGPYDQVTITMWYDEGCLRDDDQIRPGPHAKWRPLRKARLAGLLDPPPANSCSVHSMHLVAEPPVWMGPPKTTATATADWLAKADESAQRTAVVSMLIAVAGGIFVITLLLVVAWFLFFFQRPEVGTPDTADRLTNQRRPAINEPTTAVDAVPVELPSLLAPLSDRTTQAGQRIEIRLAAANPFQQSDLRFELESAPPAVTVTGNVLAWIPTPRDAGRFHTISVRVTDSSRPPRTEIVSFAVRVTPPPPIERQPTRAPREKVF